MVTKSFREGLIVSPRASSTAPLDELLASCDWPAVLEATPQRLRRELSLRVPEVTLFWLDDEGHVDATVQLVSWLRNFQPAIRRVAVGFRVVPDVEVALRAAGAHVYLAANDRVAPLLESMLAGWPRHTDTSPTGASPLEASPNEPQSCPPPVPDRTKAPLSVTLHPSGPP